MNVPPDKLPVSRGQRIVRYIGAVILSACAVMLVLGLTVLSNRLHGLRLLQYWSWCFLLAAGSILCAFWDMVLVRRAFKRTRRKLFHDHFMTGEIAEKLKKDNSGGKR